MSDPLFTNLNEFKLCMNTIVNKNGLLDRRGYELHSSYNNIDYEKTNNESSYELIATKPESNNYIFMYFINNSSFLSKTYKTKNKNIYDINNIVKSLYNIDLSVKIEVNLIVILTRNLKINTTILQKKIAEKIKVHNINIFIYNYLIFNISTHKLNPPYIKVISNKADIQKICEKKNIDNTNKLPKILITDPLSNFYGLKKGELFEFKRPNKNSGVYIYYRVCILP